MRILVADDGKGFDTGAVPARRLGIKVSILGRMDSVGGLARIESDGGRGTAVELLWPAGGTP